MAPRLHLPSVTERYLNLLNESHHLFSLFMSTVLSHMVGWHCTSCTVLIGLISYYLGYYWCIYPARTLEVGHGQTTWYFCRALLPCSWKMKCYPLWLYFVTSLGPASLTPMRGYWCMFKGAWSLTTLFRINCISCHFIRKVYWTVQCNSDHIRPIGPTYSYFSLPCHDFCFCIILDKHNDHNYKTLRQCPH